MRTQKESLDALIQIGDPNAIASFFFSRSSTEVPPQIDIEQAKQGAITFIQQKTQGYSGAALGAAAVLDYFASSVGVNAGLLNIQVDALLCSQECLNHLSLLLPFHHWEMLCVQLTQFPEKRMQLAVKLIALMKTNELTPESILPAINSIFSTQFCTTDSYVAQQITVIKRMEQGTDIRCETATQKSKAIQLLRVHCIPLLAKNIGSQDCRAHFLAHMADVSDEALCQYYPSLFRILANIEDKSKFKETVYTLIQTLTPDMIQREDLIDSQVYAEQCRVTLQKTMLQKAKFAVIMSHTFQEKAADFFHEKDARIVRDCLEDRRHAETLSDLDLNTVRDASEAVAAISNAHNREEPSNIPNRIRDVLPPLANTRLLSERIDTFQREMQGQSELKWEAFDHNKLADMLLEQIQPIVQHAQFKNLLQHYMDSLTQEDVQFIFMSRGLNQADAQKIAARLCRFKALISQRDFAAFKHEFLVCEPNRELCLENYRLTLVLSDFDTLTRDIMGIHGYYGQQDEKGREWMHSSCVLDAKLSETAKKIRIPAYGDLMSRFSRKLFFMQATRIGLPLASQVHADAHQQTLRVLANINHHLLRPLWWSVNNWSFVISIIARLKLAFIGLQDGLYYSLHSVGQNFGRSSTHYESPFTLSTHFDESAFDLAKTMNGLVPLSSEDIVGPACPKDVITQVEEHIARLGSSHLHLFAQPRGVINDTTSAIQMAY